MAFNARANADGNGIGNGSKAVEKDLRDVFIRCVCREVGFSNKTAFEHKMQESFGRYLNLDKEMASKIQLAYHHNVPSGDTSFPSEAKKKELAGLRPRPRKKKHAAQETGDGIMHPSSAAPSSSSVPNTWDHGWTMDTQWCTMATQWTTHQWWTTDPGALGSSLNGSALQPTDPPLIAENVRATVEDYIEWQDYLQPSSLHCGILTGA